MDSPTLDRTRHLDALDALGRVNAVSLATGRVWAEIVRVAQCRADAVRVLDVVCGGGDVLLGLARRASKAGVSVELHGCDRSPVALARARALGGDALAVRFREMDVLGDPLPSGYDVVCSTLFLHHLSRAEAIHLLASMAEATERVLIIQDLRRTRLGYFFARLGLGMLTRSDVARHDGLVSVRAALTLAEAEALCRDAGLDRAEVRPCWPQRFTVRWERA